MSDVNIHLEIRNNRNQLEKVVDILKAKGNSSLAKAKDCNDNFPLHIAMFFGEKGVFDLVQLLVTMNPEGVRTKNRFGNLPIHCLGHMLGPGTDDGNKAREFLLKEYPKGSRITNKEGQLPIHCAADSVFGDTAKLLLKEHPEAIKVEDNYGCLPVHYACKKGHSTIRLLVDAYPEGLQHKTTQGNLPIHRALSGGLTDVGEYDFLIQSYPDCLKVENKKEQLPLHLAALTGSIEVAELICTKYPIAAKKPDQFGKSPIDVAVERKDYPMLSTLDQICPDAFCHDPIIELLEEPKCPKYRRELISVMLKSKLETMKAEKEHAQIALTEHTKKYEEQKKLQEASNESYEEKLGQEKEHVASLKEQVEHAEKIIQDSKIALEEENMRAAALAAENKKYEEQLEQEKHQIASLKELGEQEKQQIASLKENAERSEKRIQSFEVARKSESKLLSRLLETSDDWTIERLKSIAKSLNTRLGALKTQFQAGVEPSSAEDLLPFLLNQADPSKEALLRTIKTIDSELTEVESTVASLSTSDETVIPEATTSLNGNPENASRKRARVSISPA